MSAKATTPRRPHATLIPQLRLIVNEDDIRDTAPVAPPGLISSQQIPPPPVSRFTAEEMRPEWGDVSPSVLESLKPLGRLTVREIYERHLFESRKRRLSARTIEAEKTTVLSRWEEFGTSSPKRWFVDQFGEADFETVGEPAANPPVGWITREDLERFVDAQLEDGYAAGSIPSTIATLCSWFNELRPRSLGGLGALYVVPRMKSAEIPIAPKRMPEWPEIQRLWKVCDRELRAVIAYVLLLGWRNSDVQAVTFESFTERFETCLWVVMKSRRKRPYPQYFPIHPCIRAWLKTLSKSASRPFQFLRSENDFRQRWRSALSAAGLSDKKAAHGGNQYEWLTLHALRRKCNEIFQDHHQGAGAWLLGHSISGKESTPVNDRHYSRVYQPLPSVKEAILSVVVPDWLWPNGKPPK